MDLDLTRLNQQPAQCVSTVDSHSHHHDVLRSPNPTSTFVSPPGFNDVCQHGHVGHHLKMMVISDESKENCTSRPFLVSNLSDVDDPLTDVSEFEGKEMKTIIQGAGTWLVLIFHNTNSRRKHGVRPGGGDGARYSWVESAIFEGVDRNNTQ